MTVLSIAISHIDRSSTDKFDEMMTKLCSFSISLKFKKKTTKFQLLEFVLETYKADFGGSLRKILTQFGVLSSRT